MVNFFSIYWKLLHLGKVLVQFYQLPRTFTLGENWKLGNFLIQNLIFKVRKYQRMISLKDKYTLFKKPRAINRGKKGILMVNRGSI